LKVVENKYFSSHQNIPARFDDSVVRENPPRLFRGRGLVFRQRLDVGRWWTEQGLK
jgi:hypothetical protein